MHGFYFNRENVVKNKKLRFSAKNARYEKMLTSKIFELKKIYKFDHFFIKCTVFALIVNNVIKNQNFNFPDKLCDIRKKC